MVFSIRHAVPEDAPSIARVHTQSWQETYPGLMPADFLARMTSDQIRWRREWSWREQLLAGGLLTGEKTVVLIAEQSGQVVAFASGGPPRDHPGYDAETNTLYALKKVQGQGIGRALFTALARELHKGGAQNMALWVLEGNPAHAWYIRQGARAAGEKIERGLREVRMAWDDLLALSSA